MTELPKILYCHCAYAQVIPEEVKLAVLKGLMDSKVEFDSVPDLCEMSARREPLLKKLADVPNLRIAACYARAVKGLFTSAGCSLPDPGTTVVNLRIQKPEEALAVLLEGISPKIDLKSTTHHEKMPVADPQITGQIHNTLPSETSASREG